MMNWTGWRPAAEKVGFADLEPCAQERESVIRVESKRSYRWHLIVGLGILTVFLVVLLFMYLVQVGMWHRGPV